MHRPVPLHRVRLVTRYVRVPGQARRVVTLWPARPPFGYRIAEARTPEARFVIVEAEAGVVRRIIRERAAGTACHVVAARLQADMVPSPSGMGRWTASRVSGISTNPAYRGVLRWREGAREISVPGAIPVIAEDTVAWWDGKRWRLPHPPA